MVRGHEYTMDAAEALKGLPKGSKGIDLREKVKVIATDTAPYHKEGETIETHPNLAASFIKSGYAVAGSPMKK